ncbi:putative GNAT family N-acyltransferase [Litoreibacter meonggei]|uniref:Putative GNAT family N-acyltransferase n=1 Tax=Litoreibacter meonggei TaxID=1049199 RepID=A0A497WRT0_9RHOB|nr:GNAT family N-acetyltransferase [Litoreibacter meonggei]RLJ51974.1 putative GNAT family N-acyltransferase [Litoreibacter meonggei]
MAQITRTDDITTCLQIRRVVFIDGQNVPEPEEIDGDDPNCIQYLATAKGAPAATARVKPLGKKAKIQRVAVLGTHRGTGLGAELMRFILTDLRADFDEAVLGSQLHAIGFYEKLGFEVFGPEFDDAGIPHRHMLLKLEEKSSWRGK